MVAYITDKLLEPDLPDIPENNNDLGRMRFYQKPATDEIFLGDGEEIEKDNNNSDSNDSDNSDPRFIKELDYSFESS